MYILIIYTCHMTHHKASANPVFYKKRFNIQAPNSAIVKAIEKIIELYPKVRITLEGGKEPVRLGLEEGKSAVRSHLDRSKVFLSMVNSKTYENEKVHKSTELEVEVEVDKEVEGKNLLSKPEGIKALRELVGKTAKARSL